MATNTATRSPDEQGFWDRIFEDRFPACLKNFKQRDPQFCAHTARDDADTALWERRASIAAEQRSAQ